MYAGIDRGGRERWVEGGGSVARFPFSRKSSGIDCSSQMKNFLRVCLCFDKFFMFVMLKFGYYWSWVVRFIDFRSETMNSMECYFFHGLFREFQGRFRKLFQCSLWIVRTLFGFAREYEVVAHAVPLKIKWSGFYGLFSF